MEFNELFKANIAYKKAAQEVKVEAETADDFLFDAADEFNESEVADVQGIINKWFFVSKTRQSSQGWKNIFHFMHQLCNDTFLTSNDWDKSWLSKMTGSYPIEQAHFTWKELVSRVDEIMSYIADRYNSGFWYPKQSGKSRRCNLYDFFCSQMKTGKCWSPFLELHCRDCVSLTMLEEMAGESIRTTCDKIVWDGVWWNVSYDTRCSLIKGALELYKWHCNNNERLANICSANKVQISSFTGLLNIVEQWHRQTKGCPPNFVTPSEKQWGALQMWCKANRGIILC